VYRNRQPGAAAPVRSRRSVLIFVGVLIGIVLTSYVLRIATDTPFHFHDSFAAAFWIGLSLHVLGHSETALRGGAGGSRLRRLSMPTASRGTAIHTPIIGRSFRAPGPLAALEIRRHSRRP
jgi:hypothetical protein